MLSDTRNSSGFFHKQYEVGTSVFPGGIGTPEVQLNWHRKAVLPGYQPYADDAMAAFNMGAGDRIAVIGAGFGEFRFVVLRDNPSFLPGNIVSCEDSRWIQNALRETEDADVRIAIQATGTDATSASGLNALEQLADGDVRQHGGDPTGVDRVLNENLLTQQSRVNVKAALGGGVNFVITEWTLMNFLTDQEAIDFSAAAHLSPLSASVCHIVSKNLDINNRDLADWRTLIPADAFYDWSTGEVQAP